MKGPSTLALFLTLALGESSENAIVRLDRVSAKNEQPMDFPGSKYEHGDDASADHRAAAIAFDEDNDLKSAIDAFGAAARYTPSVASNWHNLAVAYMGREETYDWNFKFDQHQKHATYVAALSAYQRSLGLNPGNKDAEEDVHRITRAIWDTDSAAAQQHYFNAKNKRVTSTYAFEADPPLDGSNVAKITGTFYTNSLKATLEDPDMEIDMGEAVRAFRATSHQHRGDGPDTQAALHNFCLMLTSPENPDAGAPLNSREAMDVCQQAAERAEGGPEGDGRVAADAFNKMKELVDADRAAAEHSSQNGDVRDL
jgi:tetratricopeptide (TPR) repeat protein